MKTAACSRVNVAFVSHERNMNMVRGFFTLARLSVCLAIRTGSGFQAAVPKDDAKCNRIVVKDESA